MIEVKNNAESLIYQTEKSLKDLGDKVTEDEKNNINSKIEELKKLLEGEDTPAIKSKTSLQELLSRATRGATDKLLAQLEGLLVSRLRKANETITLRSREYWEDASKSSRQALYELVSGSTEIDEGVRQELADVIADYRPRSRSEERRVGKECRSRWSPYH